MKKIFAILFAGLGMLSLTSCITSLQPVVTFDKIITDQRITGEWVYEETAINIEPLPKANWFRT